MRDCWFCSHGWFKKYWVNTHSLPSFWNTKSMMSTVSQAKQKLQKSMETTTSQYHTQK